MQLWGNIFKAIIVLIGVSLIAFNAELYLYARQQKAELDSIKDKEDVEAEFNTNKFKNQQDQMDRINKALEDARQQIEDQKDALAQVKNALLQEAEKRHQMEMGNKDAQISLVDLKAQADAMKQDMKGWQKDYASILAQYAKRIEDSRDEIKAIESKLNSSSVPPVDNQELGPKQ
jgi:chromosome segregation ATPase